MRILVTGAKGLLGTKLTELITAKGEHEVFGLGRSTSDREEYPYHSIDITDRDRLHSIISGIHPDVVINTAAMTQVDDCETQQELCHKINVAGVANLADACRKTNAFLLQVSTDFIFDGSQGPLHEEEEPNPVNYYGKSKLEAEQVVRESGIPWAIARTVLVYGITPDMSRSNIVLWVRDSLRKGKPIQVVDDQWRTPTLAEDLAMGCSLIATKKKEGIFHISGEELMTPYEIAIATAEYFELDTSLITRTDSTKFTQPALRPPKTGFIIDKAKTELGYQPSSFREGLAMLSSQLPD